MPDNNVANYKEQGGARDVIGGSLDVVSGGEIDFESGGACKIAGVALTATAAELNAVHSQGAVAADYAKLHAVTVTAAQINRTGVTTTGVVEASKVVVVDANKKIDTLDITTPLIGGTTITATAAQLNRAGVTTAGTVEASKVVVVGASKDVDHLRITELMLGAVTVTVTGTVLNKLIQAATAGIAITGGQIAFTGSTAINTGLASVNGFGATQVSTPSLTTGIIVTAIPGSTAGYIVVLSWKGSDPVANDVSTTAAWSAIGPA